MNNGNRQQHLPKLKLRQRTRTCSSDSGVEVTFCTNTQSTPCPPIFSTKSRQQAFLDRYILWTSPFQVLKILKWFRPFFLILTLFVQVGSESPQDLLEDTLNSWTGRIEGVVGQEVTSFFNNKAVKFSVWQIVSKNIANGTTDPRH